MTRAALNRIRRLEGARAGDEAAVYLAESDIAAAELVAGTETRPLVVVTGDSRHNPPVRQCTLRDMLDEVALHGRAIYEPHPGPISDWRLWCARAEREPPVR